MSADAIPPPAIQPPNWEDPIADVVDQYGITWSAKERATYAAGDITNRLPMLLSKLVAEVANLRKQLELSKSKGQLLTPGEVAKELSISRAGVYHWLSVGRIRSVRVGKFPRVTREELARFIAEGDAKPLDEGNEAKDA